MDELTKEMEELRALVASIAPVNLALSGHQDSLVRRYVSIRRRFDYAAYAVALYASFEKFIENLVTAYVQLESRRVQYAELPKKLVKKHLARTAEILSRGRIGEGRYAGLSELGIVKNLFDCLNGANPYALNEVAVVAHDQNLRAGEIDRVFAAVGIEAVCDSVRWADYLLDWYCNAQQLDARPQDGVPSATVEEWLKDIVERRNQVAHRGGNPDDLLGADKMRDAIQFIEAFSRSVFAMTVGRYLRDHYAVPGKGIQLVQRQGDGPHKKGTVVVIEKPAQRLFVGQPVFVLIDGRGARWGRIQSMKVADADVQAIEPGDAAANGIGVALDFKCPKGAPLVALADEDDVVWGRPDETVAPSA
ncbi:MAE_28990/MAE_18760 family HEPN-like nuclease [Myxococcus vastator]|uniref:MAE_28990/MAE_18760 family HEPN-like nuclease n=1 Tax=Myxococcus vastator TaxID=2709664 RepID=UPI0013D108F9|nr:MAE_28990/MAE_18760 family HEPN-like nuclease [Myxococcus vastator]